MTAAQEALALAQEHKRVSLAQEEERLSIAQEDKHVSIVFDSRERAWHAACGVGELKPLPLGDLQITTKKCKLLVERKTWGDWSKSMADHRYREQQARSPQARIEAEEKGLIFHMLYLIEGAQPTAPGGISSDCLHQALLSTQRRGHVMMFSQNLQHSAMWVDLLIKNIAKWEEPVSSPTHRVAHGQQVQLQKNKNITPQNALLYMIMGIPNVGASVAEAVLREYRTMTALCASVTKDPQLSEKTIAQLGGSRKVGPVLAKQIVDYLGK